MVLSDTRERRKAFVHSRVAAGTPLTHQDYCAIADEFGVHYRTIYRDGQELQEMDLDATLIPSTHLLHTLQQLGGGFEFADRSIEILRTLGRLEYMTTAMVRHLLFPDKTVRTARRHLNHLHPLGLVWNTKISMEQVRPSGMGYKATTMPVKSPYVWGLTPEGLELLFQQETESDHRTYELLHTRDRRAPKVPEVQLNHDLQVSTWCALALDGLRRCRAVETVVCHVEYVSARNPDGKEFQRMDAFFAFQLNPSRKQHHHPLWAIPWAESPILSGNHIVQIALEVDRGTEPLKTLLNKSRVYMSLTKEQKIYQQMLGGPAIPVFLVPPGKRAAQIAQEWQQVWQDTPALATHVNLLQKGGVLWGTYVRLKDAPKTWKESPTNLLQWCGLSVSYPQWQEWTQGWNPKGTTQI